jgi:hypothetical protein
MAFSVSRSRPFRSLGLYKSTGKHAAHKGRVPEPRPSAENADRPRSPAHAAAMPRLTGPRADGAQPNASRADAPRASASALEATVPDVSTDGGRPA